MIYTVTLNPSIDYVVYLDKFCEGRTNRTIREDIYVGGKGINVSKVLTELNIRSTAYGFVAGFTGDEIERELQSENITADFIHLKGGNSRINVKINAGAETEINGQGPKISPNEIEKLLQKIEQIQDGDVLVLAGSVPNTLPHSIYEEILKRIGKKDVMIAVDAEKDLLLPSLRFKPFLIKPNRRELCEIFNAEPQTEKEVETYARQLQAMGAKNVLISLGSDGAMLIDENGTRHRLGVIKEQAVGTIGSGDSMVAGFLAGYMQTHDYSHALKLGTVCANATALSIGLATKEKINEVREKFHQQALL